MSVTLCVVVGATSVAYIETLYMKAQLKKEIKELNPILHIGFLDFEVKAYRYPRL